MRLCVRWHSLRTVTAGWRSQQARLPNTLTVLCIQCTLFVKRFSFALPKTQGRLMSMKSSTGDGLVPPTERSAWSLSATTYRARSISEPASHLPLSACSISSLSTSLSVLALRTA